MGEADSGKVSGRTELAIVRDPGDEARKIQQSIDDARAQIARSLEAIQEEVEDSLDWKGWVEDNPWKAVGIAAAVGLYFGLR
jgi:ElaB/YqjD/DUF883 family membrane-anchored ribosome-binding protein